MSKKKEVSKFSYKSLLYSFVSLTNSQAFITRFLKAQELLPEISLPRLMNSSGLTEQETKDILLNVPSLGSKPWTEYFLKMGEAFERKENYQAATMMYVMGGFPKEPHAWKSRINERRHKAFFEWCRRSNFPFQERLVQVPHKGRFRYYIFKPENASADHPVPLLLFMNGSDGSAEEIAFCMTPYRHEGMAFGIMAVVGSVDSDFPMQEDSEKAIHAILDDLQNVAWIDQGDIGMVGFSFGAFWTFMAAKTDRRIKYAVCNGIPLRHTFTMGSSMGMNPIIATSLMCLFQVKHPFFLLKIVKKLSERADKLLQKESGPILAINGDKDSIVNPLDTELLGKLPGNKLMWLKGDEHCGLFQFPRMIQILVAWARRHSGQNRPRGHSKKPRTSGTLR